MPKKKLLLLVEDNALLEGMYLAAFEKAGFDVILAHDGGEGLELAKDRKPDGILLDLLMPGMDGFQVLEHLGESGELKKIKTIVLSSVTDKDELARAVKLGALECLVKSELALSEIVKRVNAYFIQ
jgi:DNA-binding response OmpR family regulator